MKGCSVGVIFAILLSSFFSVDLPSFTSDIVMSIAKQQKQNYEECSNIQIRRNGFKN